MHDLSEECKKLTGKGFDMIKGCHCPDGKIFKLGADKKAGSCIEQPFNLEKTNCRSSHCWLSADKVIDADFGDFKGRVLTVNFENQDQIDQLIELLSPEEKRLEIWSPHLEGSSPDSELTIELDPSSFKIEQSSPASEVSYLQSKMGLGINLLEDHKISFSFLDKVINTDLTLYARSLEDVPYLSGITLPTKELLLDSLDLQEFPNQNLAVTLKRSYGKLIEKLDDLSQSHQWKTQLFRGDSCKDICLMTAQLGNTDGFETTVHQEIYRGIIHKRFLALRKKNQNILIQMGPSFYPSLILYTKFKKTSGNGIRGDYHLSDRSGNTIYRNNYKPLNPAVGFYSSVSRQVDRNGPVLGICERIDESSIDQDSELFENLVLGTHQSLYGWHQTPAGIIHFFDPIFSPMHGGTGYQRDQSGHYYPTLMSAKSIREDTQFIPLGTRCMLNYQQWKRPVSQTGAKVISLSTVYSFKAGSRACNELLDKTVRSSEGRKKLWVFGAGNESLENPTGMGCFFDPSLDNVISVAASGHDPAQLADYSNYGTRHADILASGTIQLSNGPERGTSFAAPKVAALAAIVAHQYPDFSPQDIRDAIYLGSTFSEALGEKVRSSGYLDFDKPYVEDAAKCLNKGDEKKRNRCLGIKYGWLSTKVPEKIKLLLKRGLIQSEGYPND